MEETQRSKDDVKQCQKQQLNADFLGKEGAEHLARKDLFGSSPPTVGILGCQNNNYKVLRLKK